jgi:hypothetical protein
MNAIQFLEGRWIPYWEKSRYLRESIDSVIPMVDFLLEKPGIHPSVVVMRANVFRKFMTHRLRLSRKLKPRKYRRFLIGVR